MGFLRMELTVVLGVILRGMVPRNGLGENSLPKAPSQPQTRATSGLSPCVKREAVFDASYCPGHCGEKALCKAKKCH